jgi:hypothetical protein
VAALESSEDWLTLDEDRFEAMLKSRGPKEDGMDEELEGFGEGEGYSDEEDNDNDDDAMEGVEGESSKEEKRAAKRAAKRLEKMAKKVEDFVQGRGALDGAQFEE